MDPKEKGKRPGGLGKMGDWGEVATTISGEVTGAEEAPMEEVDEDQEKNQENEIEGGSDMGDWFSAVKHALHYLTIFTPF
jgi:hypothetical protein